jgi:hypothetical protein
LPPHERRRQGVIKTQLNQVALNGPVLPGGSLTPGETGHLVTVAHNPCAGEPRRFAVMHSIALG